MNTILHQFFRRKKQLTRLLTLVCFFHFSGLNQCYAYVASVSPLNPVQSVQLVGKSIEQSHESIFTQSGIVSSIKGTLRSVTQVAQRLERVFSNAPDQAPRITEIQPLAHSPLQGDRIEGRDRELWVLGLSNASSLPHSYIKKDSEFWKGRQQSQFISPVTVLRDTEGFENGQAVKTSREGWMEKRSKIMISFLSGHLAARVHEGFLSTQIASRLTDRTPGQTNLGNFFTSASFSSPLRGEGEYGGTFNVTIKEND